MRDNSNELVEIYKLHSEMIDKLSQKRNVTSQFNIALLSGLITFLISILDKNILISKYLICLILGGLGIIICIIWIIHLRRYKKILEAKFTIITELEEKLAFAFYQREWEILNGKSNYKSISNIEMIVPLILIIPFVLLVVYGFVIR